MTVEVRPLGVRCNISCAYCYQATQRSWEEANKGLHYDLGAIKSAVANEGRPFTLFGGEPLLVPICDLEELWSWGFVRFGKNSVQTNGTLISSEHIRLFKKYNVGVGISCDGPGELNDLRGDADIRVTRKLTTRTCEAIERLCRERIAPSIIVTLHRCNGSAARLPQLRDWLMHLDHLGVRAVRIHVLEVDHPDLRDSVVLSPEENVAGFLCLSAVEKTLTRLRLDVFRDMRRLLLGNDERVTCVWKGCDPYTTSAVCGAPIETRHFLIVFG